MGLEIVDLENLSWEVLWFLKSLPGLVKYFLNLVGFS